MSFLENGNIVVTTTSTIQSRSLIGLGEGRGYYTHADRDARPLTDHTSITTTIINPAFSNIHHSRTPFPHCQDHSNDTGFAYNYTRTGPGTFLKTCNRGLETGHEVKVKFEPTDPKTPKSMAAKLIEHKEKLEALENFEPLQLVKKACNDRRCPPEIKQRVMALLETFGITPEIEKQ